MRHIPLNGSYAAVVPTLLRAGGITPNVALYAAHPGTGEGGWLTPGGFVSLGTQLGCPPVPVALYRAGWSRATCDEAEVENLRLGDDLEVLVPHGWTPEDEPLENDRGCAPLLVRRRGESAPCGHRHGDSDAPSEPWSSTGRPHIPDDDPS